MKWDPHFTGGDTGHKLGFKPGVLDSKPRPLCSVTLVLLVVHFPLSLSSEDQN